MYDEKSFSEYFRKLPLFSVLLMGGADEAYMPVETVGLVVVTAF